MKFYSEKLTRLFDTEAALVEAEAAELKKEEDRNNIKKEILILADVVATDIEQMRVKLEAATDLLTDEDAEELLHACISKFTSCLGPVIYSIL